MYVNYATLKAAVENGDRRYANFYDTYGFLIIRGVLSQNEFNECVREYDSEYKRRTGELGALEMLINRLGFSGPKRFGFRRILKRDF